MTSRVVPFELSEPVPGIRLVTEPMPHVRSVSIGLWIDVGSRDEPDEIAGADHFLEHMLFKGTERRTARDIANTFDAVGGEINAYSAREHTCCYARVLGSDLPVAVDVLCDMFRNAVLRGEDFESEKKVILEEIRMAADVPEDRVHDLFSETAWPGHPLGRSVLGTSQTVGGLTRDRLAAFFHEGYVSDRLVVAVAGDVDTAAVAKLLVDGIEPGTAPHRRTPGDTPAFGGPRAAYEKRPSEQVNVVLGFEAMGRKDPDRYALSVLSVLYGGGMSSRLFQEVREKRGLAYSVYSHEHLHLETGTFTIYVGTQESTVEEVLRIVRDEAAKVVAGDLTDEEVERAKGHLRGGLVLGMDDPGGRMSRLGRSELLHGEVLTVDELLDRVDGVSTSDVGRVAKRIFAGGGAALACVGPVDEGSLDFAVEPLA
ncbi:MAG: M16 family metallopeptidase [Actinomycetota bacterium]